MKKPLAQPAKLRPRTRTRTPAPHRMGAHNRPRWNANGGGRTDRGGHHGAVRGPRAVRGGVLRSGAGVCDHRGLGISAGMA